MRRGDRLASGSSPASASTNAANPSASSASAANPPAPSGEPGSDTPAAWHATYERPVSAHGVDCPCGRSRSDGRRRGAAADEVEHAAELAVGVAEAGLEFDLGD